MNLDDPDNKHWTEIMHSLQNTHHAASGRLCYQHQFWCNEPNLRFIKKHSTRWRLPLCNRKLTLIFFNWPYQYLNDLLASMTFGFPLFVPTPSVRKIPILGWLIQFLWLYLRTVNITVSTWWRPIKVEMFCVIVSRWMYCTTNRQKSSLHITLYQHTWAQVQ